VLNIPNKITVVRGGAPNLFSTSAPIKNVYRKNTSLVSRMLICKPSFDKVQDILTAINKRNLLVSGYGRQPMSLSTVSKALKNLEQDLIINRNGGIRLVQPDKLLGKLAENYRPRELSDRFEYKSGLNLDKLKTLLKAISQKVDVPISVTGLASVNQYAVMQRSDTLSIYCPDAERLLKELPGKETDRFPDLRILETDEPAVFFDGRKDKGFLWASPVQVYLELMAGDKRDRETANQVKDYLLNNLKDHSNAGND
jgi:hypothetical protein